MIARLLLPVTLLVLVAMESKRPVSAQEGCYNIPNDGTESVVGSMKHAATSCTVTDGTYVLYQQYYQWDGNASANGSCILRGPAPGGGCQINGTQLRGVGAVKIVPSGAVGHTMYPDTTLPQTFNSAVDPLQIPPGRANWWAAPLGTRELNFSGTANLTSCNLQPIEYFDTGNPLTVHVLNCAPKFLSPASGQTKPRHISPGVHYVSFNPDVPPEVIAAVSTAMNDWEAVQSDFTFDHYEGVCNYLTNPQCIVVTRSTNTGYCSQIDTPIGQTDANGVWQIGLRMDFPDGAETWDAEHLRRFANHEFAHAMGLDNQNSSCPRNKGLMGPVASCSDYVVPTIITPSVTDFVPIHESVFGNNATTSCPPPQ